MCPPPACICLVVPDGAGLSEADGLLADSRLLSQSLVRAGWKVHVLLCPLHADADRERHAAGQFEGPGVHCHSLARMEFPHSVTLEGPNQSPLLRAADQVCHALTLLHEAHEFDAIEFVHAGGLGFRAVQAKRAGLALTDVRLLVRVYGTAAWLRRRHHRRPDEPMDLAAAFSERYTFEHADGQLAACPSVFEEVRRLGWAVRDDARITPCVGEPGALAPGEEDPGARLRGPTPPGRHQALVTIGMPYYNLGQYLDDALASLAAQTYPALEILIIDDGSTEPESREAFHAAQARYPQFRFLSQPNSGIGATRNRALAEARGKYFLPMDADNIARPDMVERFVAALERHPDVAAMSCYFLAFRDSRDIAASAFAYSYRPTGGPHVLACLKNVYGDGNALFRTEALRAVGGFETDRDTSYEDWEAFVKLVHAGNRLDVVPDFLFYYRHRDASFSRATDRVRNHQRVLRRYFEIERLPPTERVALWSALVGFQQRLESLEQENADLRCRLATRRHRWADRVHAFLSRVPFLGVIRQCPRPAAVGSTGSRASAIAHQGSP